MPADKNEDEFFQVNNEDYPILFSVAVAVMIGGIEAGIAVASDISKEGLVQLDNEIARVRASGFPIKPSLEKVISQIRQAAQFEWQ